MVNWEEFGWIRLWLDLGIACGKVPRWDWGKRREISG